MLAECKKTNKKYTDREFPPNESSLIRGNKMEKQDRILFSLLNFFQEKLNKEL